MPSVENRPKSAAGAKRHPIRAASYPKRVYMEEIQQTLGRHRSTIISWERSGRLPADLEFKRDDGNWRYWSRAQLKKALIWVNGPDMTQPVRGRHRRVANRAPSI